VPQLSESTDPCGKLNVHFVKQILYKWYRAQFALLSLYYLIKLNSNSNLDIVYTRSLINFVPLSILNIVLQKTLILEANCIWSDEQIINEDGLMKNFKHTLIRFLELFAAKHAHYIITVTQGIKVYFVAAGINEEKIFVVENGANIELFKPIDSQYAQRLMGLPDKYKYVCFVGNLAPWQGTEYLIQAAPHILKECSDVRFLVVGDGKMRGEMENKALQLAVFDQFIFTGMVPYEQVTYYINASTICVAPFIITRNEKIGLSPLKMYEYLACGKPVVASDIPGVRHLLNKSDSGVLVEPENSEELAIAILKLLHNEELRKEMGMKGRKYIVENHSWGAAARKVADVCERSINKSGKHRLHGQST